MVSSERTLYDSSGNSIISPDRVLRWEQSRDMMQAMVRAVVLALVTGRSNMAAAGLQYVK